MIPQFQENGRIAPMAKVEALKNQLEALKAAIPDLKGVLLASNEGLPIAHSFTNGTDPNRVAALAAAVVHFGAQISENLSTGALGEVSVQAEEGSRCLLRRHQGDSGRGHAAGRERRLDPPGSAADGQRHWGSILGRYNPFHEIAVLSRCRSLCHLDLGRRCLRISRAGDVQDIHDGEGNESKPRMRALSSAT